MQLNSLLKIIEKLAYRNGSYSNCLEDALSWIIGCFLVNGDPELAETLKSRYKQDYGLFREFLDAVLKIYHDNLHDNGPESLQKFNWIDPFGELYMEISGSHKKSGLGQFFTPDHICNMMAMMIMDDNKAERTMEPCVGSGRMLLAANSITPGMFHVACDIDPICVKMATLNFMFHGMTAEICCADGLLPQSNWKFGYRTNYHLQMTGVPTILPITTEQSYVFNSVLPGSEKMPKINVSALKSAILENQISAQQLSLF